MSKNNSYRTITIKLGLLLQTQPAFKDFMLKDMPSSLAHPIARLYKRCEAEVVAYRASEKLIYLKHGDMQPDESIVLRPEEVSEFSDKFNELNEVEIELSVPNISIDDLDSNGVNVSPATLLGLDWLITGLDAYEDEDDGSDDNDVVGKTKANLDESESEDGTIGDGDDMSDGTDAGN